MRGRVQQDALSSYNKKERPRCPGPVPLVLSSSRLSASDQMFASCFWVYPATLLQFSLSRTILTHILSRHLGRGKTAPEVRCNQPGRPSSKDQVYLSFVTPNPFLLPSPNLEVILFSDTRFTVSLARALSRSLSSLYQSLSSSSLFGGLIFAYPIARTLAGSYESRVDGWLVQVKIDSVIFCFILFHCCVLSSHNKDVFQTSESKIEPIPKIRLACHHCFRERSADLELANPRVSPLNYVPERDRIGITCTMLG